jgi:hypothetical protein
VLWVRRRAALVEAVEAAKLRIGDLLAQKGQAAAFSFRPHGHIAAVEVRTGVKDRRIAWGFRPGEAEMH